MSWLQLAEAVADVSHPSPANSPARMPRPFIPHRIFWVKMIKMYEIPLNYGESQTAARGASQRARRPIPNPRGWVIAMVDIAPQFQTLEAGHRVSLVASMVAFDEGGCNHQMSSVVTKNMFSFAGKPPFVPWCMQLGVHQGHYRTLLWSRWTWTGTLRSRFQSGSSMWPEWADAGALQDTTGCAIDPGWCCRSHHSQTPVGRVPEVSHYLCWRVMPTLLVLGWQRQWEWP